MANAQEKIAFLAQYININIFFENAIFKNWFFGLKKFIFALQLFNEIIVDIQHPRSGLNINT
ncbi:hypothetical protein [Nostoc sp. CMAA1605]|uniref:hypothetical protein n=1 Tax=Nostoc sp. CMAA1605 TaxID=2055159 RepID=UPI001F321419|nr:hypothetical protein [Nostoc sp. CMAA1605]MCF4970618.1 hypothetical protein [Nostoc sp. CMAA1605]